MGKPHTKIEKKLQNSFWENGKKTWKIPKFTLIWPLMSSKVKGHEVNTSLFTIKYVFHTNFGHNMHRFWDINPNR